MASEEGVSITQEENAILVGEENINSIGRDKKCIVQTKVTTIQGRLFERYANPYFEFEEAQNTQREREFMDWEDM